MALPAAAEQVLTKNAIEYKLLESLNESTLKSSLLQDSKGQLQIIHATDSLLDVDRLCRDLNRELSSCSEQDVKKICSKLRLDHCPSIPGVLGTETIIDQTLLEEKDVCLATGIEQQTISVNALQFKALCNGATFAAVSIPFNNLQTGQLDTANDIEEITAAVANFTQLRIKQRLEETLEFPPLPETAQRIIKLRVDPNADIQDLSHIVETDPSLAAQVVSWAASPYYAAPGKIKSVHDAIVRVLGFDLVLNLSLGLALGKTLSLPKDAARGFTPYWQQAVYAATAIEALVGAIAPKERPAMGMAYLAGLLHNFGHLILAEVFPPQFSSICRYQEANPFSNHCYIERHLLGVTREQLGGWLLRLWNMPDEVCTALRFQNEADYDGDDFCYANLMFIALRLLRRHGIGDGPLEEIPASLYQRLYLDPEKAAAAIEKMLESSEELNAMASNLAA